MNKKINKLDPKMLTKMKRWRSMKKMAMIKLIKLMATRLRFYLTKPHKKMIIRKWTWPLRIDLRLLASLIQVDSLMGTMKVKV